MTTELINEPVWTGEFVLSEGPRSRSRDEISVAENQTLVAGEVLGAQTVGAAAATAGSNTGNGVFGAITNSAGAPVGTYDAVCTQATTGTAAATAQKHEANVGTETFGTITVGAAAQLGAYRLELTSTGATATFDVFEPAGELLGSGAIGTAFSEGGLGFTVSTGGTPTAGDAFDIIVTDDDVATFSLTDPYGKVLAPITVGTAYTGDLNFTLAQGSAKFVVGDSFAIVLAAGSGQYLPVNASAVDGTQNAAAIAYAPLATPSSAAANGVAITRDAEVKSGMLTWPAGASSPEIAAWTAQLAKLDIIVR